MEKMALMTCLFLWSSPSKPQHKPSGRNEAAAVSSHIDVGDEEKLESVVSDKKCSTEALSDGSNVCDPALWLLEVCSTENCSEAADK